MRRAEHQRADPVDTHLIVELKTDGGEANIQPVIDLVAEYGRDDGTLTIAWFREDDLQPVREQLPQVPTNMPESETTAFSVRHLLGLHPWWNPPGQLFQVPEIHDSRQVVTPRFIRAAQRLQDELAWLTSILTALTSLGDEEFSLFLLPLTYWPLRAALVALIAAIAWSRIHLGVHFLEDMVTGVAVGLVLLAAFVALQDRVAAWWARVGSVERVLASLVAPLALIAPATLLSGRLQGVRFDWPALADPAALTGASGVVTPAATLAGDGDGDGTAHWQPPGAPEGSARPG